MLVDNKFYFLSIPRCASTSFHITCLRLGLDLKFTNNKNASTPNLQLSNEELADNLTHTHEPLSQLYNKFGDEYEIISIKRNRYERYLSVWKHIIDELYRIGEYSIGDMLSNTKLSDILPETADVLSDINYIREYIKDFFIANNIYTTNWYVYNMFEIGLTPTSFIHHHNKKIIWFDIEKLHELEEWVSIKLNSNFKLEKINSSNHIKSIFEINDEFIYKYDTVYNQFDLFKTETSLI
jgi:hypothetical protein